MLKRARAYVADDFELLVQKYLDVKGSSPDGRDGSSAHPESWDLAVTAYLKKWQSKQCAVSEKEGQLTMKCGIMM